MQDSPSERQQIAEMMSDRYREEWDERFERNLEASRISREVARVLQDIDNSCLKPLLCFLRSVPSGFSPLPVSSLEKLLEQSEEEYNSLSEVDSEEAELSSSDGGSWADIVMGSGAGLTGLRQSANLHRRLLGGYLSSPIRYGYGLSCGQFGADRGRGVQYGGSERQEAPAVESTEEVQSSTKTFKVAISVQQVQHIYRIGGISNENVWTALFGDYTKDEEGRYVVARYKMPSFLSNKILMESYSSVVQVSELQNNSMQVYMFCRSVLKHFCMDILTPRILIHANIFLLWNGTLKDVFSNKTYERLLSDILSTTTDSSDQADSSSSCEGNNLGVSDGVFSLYSGLVDGTLPSLLLLRVLEEEFAKFSVLAHFMIRIFGYLDRNSCHVFSNSPDLNITALLYFYKCVFFPLSSSFTAALLNIVTVERDFFIQASLRCLFSSRVDDGKVFDCVDKLASGGEDAAEMEAEVEAEVEEALLGARRDHERRSPQKCSKESHFLNEMYFNGNSLLLQRFSDKIHNKILFNVINNIVLTMSSSSSNKISLKRTNTSSVAEGSSEGSGGTSSSYLEPDAFGRGGQWPRVERRMTGLDRASRTIDPSLDLGGGEGQSGQGTSRSSGLFWFSDEEIDQTVYKTTIEDPFLRGTLYYYYNRLDGFFGFLDLKQSCMLVNWILLEEERRVVGIFPKRSHAGFFKLLESVLFYFLSRKLVESFRQSICDFVFLNRKEMGANGASGTRPLGLNFLFKGSIRSYINNDNYCALKSIYSLFLKDTLRPSSQNMLNKILMKSEISNYHKKLEFPTGGLHMDISKLANSVGAGMGGAAGSSSRTASGGSSRQSCFVYLAYVIYESIIEDVTKAIKFESDGLLKGEDKASIRTSDRFLSIQIILSLLRRYRRFIRHSFEDDKALLRIVHRAFYDGLILYLQDSVSPNSHSLVLFMLSVWMNSFIDSRLVRLHSIFACFREGVPRPGSSCSGAWGRPQAQSRNSLERPAGNKPILRLFSRFVLEWFNRFLVGRNLNRAELLVSDAVLIVDEISRSGYFSEICSILMMNAMTCVSLLKLLPNFEVIVSLYKDRLCKRLLNISLLGANPTENGARMHACICLQMCLEYFTLFCLERSRGDEGSFDYLGGGRSG